MTRIVKEPEERRKELIDTAEQLFIAQGYEQTSISDIVREVNVSQGAFYYYFESKEDVLVAAMEKTDSFDGKRFSSGSHTIATWMRQQNLIP